MGKDFQKMMHPTMSGWIVYLAGVVLGIWLVTTVNTYFSAPPSVIESMRIVEEIIYPGQRFTTEYELFRYRNDCKVNRKKTFTDKDGFVFDVYDTERKKEYNLGRDTYLREGIVPLTIGPGLVRYDVEVEFECNILNWLFPIKVKSKPYFVIVGSPKS